MKTYTMRKRINLLTENRNQTFMKFPFYECLVNGLPLVSKTIDPKLDQKGEGRVFAWGYRGKYPINLAVSILCDLLEIENIEVFLNPANGYKFALDKFYEDYIIDNKNHSWEIGENELIIYLKSIIGEMENDK